MKAQHAFIRIHPHRFTVDRRAWRLKRLYDFSANDSRGAQTGSDCGMQDGSSRHLFTHVGFFTPPTNRGRRIALYTSGMSASEGYVPGSTGNSSLVIRQLTKSNGYAVCFLAD